MAESEDDRRRAERIPINEEFARFGGGGPGSTWVSDLSPTGVFVHTDELLPVGAHIELRFTVVLDDPFVIEAVGKVVRHSHRPRGMGVAFALIEPEMTARIDEVLASRRPTDSGAPLRLPEPSRVRFEIPADDDDESSGLILGLARPAPIQGLDVRRVSEEAVTAAFPKLDPAEVDQAKTQVFKAVDDEISDDDEIDTIEVELEDEDDPIPPPPRFGAPPPVPPKARPHATRDDARTTVYKAVPVADDDED